MTKSEMVRFRLEPERLEQFDLALGREGITRSQFLERAVTEYVQTYLKDPFGPTAASQTPQRVFAVQHWHGLDMLDMLESLKTFGVASFEDLSSGATLMKGFTPDTLRTFARIYEVSLPWLTTGDGKPYQPTHKTFDAAEILGQIISLRAQRQLEEVQFVAPPGTKLTEPGHVLLRIDKPHPEQTLPASKRVYETYPVISTQNAELIKLLRVLCAAFAEDTDLYPNGYALTPDDFEAVAERRLHHAQAERVTTAWHPESQLRCFLENNELSAEAACTRDEALKWDRYDVFLERLLPQKVTT